jgi:anti-anti-sigma factor
MSVTNENESLTVAIATGEVDVTTAEAFDRELGAAMRAAQEAGAQRLILDFSRVHYLDSGGVSRLIDVRSRLADLGCRLELTEVQRPVERALDVLGLKATFAVA